MPSTERAPNSDVSTNVYGSQDKVDALEKAAASLEGDLQKSRSERCIERFFWIFSHILVLNILVAWFAPVSAMIISALFSVLLLLGLGKWLEVPFIAAHLERLFERLMGRLPGKNETE